MKEYRKGAEIENIFKMCLNAHCCIKFRRIPEIDYNEEMYSHAQIRTQGAEKQLRKVNWLVGCSQTPIVHKTIMQYAPLILSYHHQVNTIQNLIQKCEVIF